jgi:putative peptidoglycan lipid II flippase
MRRRDIVANTIWVAIGTLLSRLIGFIRQILLSYYLGAGQISDAFMTAFKIPNSLRKIFAEGALNAVLVPELVKHRSVVTRTKNGILADEVLTACILGLGILLTIVCTLLAYHAPQVIAFTAPGFAYEQTQYAQQFLVILIFYLVGISIGSAFAAGMASMHRFISASFGQSILNITFCSVLLGAIFYDLSVTTVAYCLVASSWAYALWHGMSYISIGGRLRMPSYATLLVMGQVSLQFFACLFSLSIVEINNFIDGQFASYLQPGTITLMIYAQDFMRIPLGVFAVAFSSIMLPSLTAMRIHRPRRLGFVMLESCKFMLWLTIPSAIILALYAPDIFTTLYTRLDTDQTAQAALFLQWYVSGLLWFSLNKIFTNLLYALQDTLTPTLICFVCTLVNIGLNMVLMPIWSAVGLIIATSLSGLIQLMLSAIVLHKKYDIHIPYTRLLQFLARFAVQIVICGGPLWLIATMLRATIRTYMPWYGNFFADGLGMWIWVAPWSLFVMIILYITRRIAGTSMHFIKK